MTPALLLRGALVAVLFILPVSVFGGEPGASLTGTISAPLRAPGKMALDQRGRLYVADAQNRGVVTFDSSGRYAGILPVGGVVRAVALGGAERLMVSHDATVSIYTVTGTPLGSLSGYDFKLPSGIATDRSGTIYVADSKRCQIAAFDPSGAFRFAFGKEGGGQGELRFPTALAYDEASDQIAVADTLNNRIQFFDARGAFRRVLGSPAQLSGPLRFTYPQGIAFDHQEGTRMYVADAFQSSVQVIDLGIPPRFLGYLGSFGSGQGELQHPSDVLFDAGTGRLLVADSSGKIDLYTIGRAGAEGAGGGADNSAGGASGAVDAGPAASGTVTATTGGGAGDASRSPAATWQYPVGDCRHGRVGSVVCRDN